MNLGIQDCFELNKLNVLYVAGKIERQDSKVI